MERLLLRTDVSNQIARNFASNVTPVIERHVKDTVNKTLIPAYSQQVSQMHSDLTRELHAEMMTLKKDVVAWQTDAFRTQDVRTTYPTFLCLLIYSHHRRLSAS